MVLTLRALFRIIFSQSAAARNHLEIYAQADDLLLLLIITCACRSWVYIVCCFRDPPSLLKKLPKQFSNLLLNFFFLISFYIKLSYTRANCCFMIVLRFCFQTTKIALGSKTSREKAAQSVSLDLVFCFLFGKLQPNMIFTRDRV
jgi:hypothetical protein